MLGGLGGRWNGKQPGLEFYFPSWPSSGIPRTELSCCHLLSLQDVCSGLGVCLAQVLCSAQDGDGQPGLGEIHSIETFNSVRLVSPVQRSVVIPVSFPGLPVPLSTLVQPPDLLTALAWHSLAAGLLCPPVQSPHYTTALNLVGIPLRGPFSGALGFTRKTTPCVCPKSIHVAAASYPGLCGQLPFLLQVPVVTRHLLSYVLSLCLCAHSCPSPPSRAGH